MNDSPFFSRRLFLRRGVQMLSVAGTVPLFLDRSARAMAAEFADNPQGAGRPDRVLVIVQLAGGNDGLNTVVPYANDDYYKARPRLGIRKERALKLNDEFGLHPAAAGFKELYDNGQLAIVHAVGYPNPNRSHFRSTDIWATAEPERVAQTGWLGKYFDACCSGSDPGAGAAKGEKKDPDPGAAVALVNEPPLALVGKEYIPLAFRSPESLTFQGAGRNESLKDAFEKLNDVDPDDHDERMMESKPKADTDEQEDFLQRTALNARVYAEQIKATAAKVQNQAKYPNGNRLAADLKLVAQMIASGLPTRVYYVTLGGFDTHSNQPFRHQNLLSTLTSALNAFTKDLQALGHLDRTTVMTFSEFGRRVAENGSQGTDHGEAAPLFVIGGRVKAGFHGTFPELAPGKLRRGDVPFTTDFRRLYATMLRDWLKADDAKVLGKKFETLGVLKQA
jgi:uncharacterized protein (DUF1501 family)